MTIDPATPAAALWMCRPVTVTAPENRVATWKSTEPDVILPLVSRIMWTKTITFPVDVSVIGGVSLAGNSCVRKGVDAAVSAIRAGAQRNRSVHNKSAVLLIEMSNENVP